jgi:Glycosyl transferase family 8
VYVASGNTYLDECAISVGTLAKRSPSLPFAIFTDEPQSWVGRSWTEENVMILPREAISGKAWTACTGLKIEAIERSPFDKTLFLDTDTAVLGNVEPMFDLLDRFDVAAGECTHWFGQCTPEILRTSQAPLSFPEFNTGVLLINSASPRTKQFITTWKEKFQQNLLRTTTCSSDQQAFREAAWVSDISILTLRQNFNYLGVQGTHMPVVIAHKILNKHWATPRASPEDLVNAIFSLEEHDAWSLLCALASRGGTAEEFERLKQFDNRGATRQLMRFDGLGRAWRGEGEAVFSANYKTSLPVHVISLYRDLRSRFAPEPSRWHERVLWSILRWTYRFGRRTFVPMKH